MARVVVTDADVLFGGTTRALFIFLAYTGTLRVHWSQRILTEMSVALVRHGRKADRHAAVAHERLMNASLETALVNQAQVDLHEAVMRAYVNDPGDAHVAACAYELRTGGYYPDATEVTVVTRNSGDYRADALATLGISVQQPDACLSELPLVEVAKAFTAWRETLPSTHGVERLLARLARDGNPAIADKLQAGMASGRLSV